MEFRCASTGARFVIVYSSNITADKETGIGAWSDDDFVRALHAGVRKNGQPLYPAFPYTSYTALSRDDILAIKATCLASPMARSPPKPNELSFPYNQRWGLSYWNALFLRKERFRSVPGKSEALEIAAPISLPRSATATNVTPRATTCMR